MIRRGIESSKSHCTFFIWNLFGKGANIALFNSRKCANNALFDIKRRGTYGDYITENYGKIKKDTYN